MRADRSAAPPPSEACPLTRSKRRLLWLLTAVLLAGMLGISVASFLVSRAAVRDQLAGGTLPLIGDTIYSEIQRDLLRPIFVSSMMASNTFVHDWVAGGERDVRRMSNYLTSVMRDYGAFTAFFVSDATRRYYHADGLLKTVAEEEPRDAWYFRVARMDAPFEINTDIDMANGDELTVFVNYRVHDDAGRFLGAIGVGLAVRSLTELLLDYGRSFGRDVYFVDAAGAFQLGFSPHGTAATLAEVPALSALAPALLEGRGESAHDYRGDGGQVFLHRRWIAPLEWYLMVEQSEGAALAPIRHAFVASLALSLAIALGVLAAAHRLLRIYQRDLEHSAAHDVLTGALNRQAFDALLERAFARDARRADRSSLMFVDIDHFKRVNDTHGHAAGDAAIRHAVEVVASTLRSDDVLCRWGGEEFCALLPGTDAGDARALAERVRAALAASPLVHAGTSIELRVSIGVAERARDEGVEAVLGRADAALYRAKHEGRDRVRLAPSPAPALRAA